ncbi:MAG: hypothetical protein HUU46_23040 [Candidatus Hydrogenedentes bacterium]|nr:hypothetical protein [Candidatus Hydrogenedentota bacterium]
MHHPIAQFVALTCHANASLCGHELPPFLITNSTAQFCESIRFVSTRRRLWGGLSNEPVAADPNAWFEYLKKKGALGVQLRCARHDDSKLPGWLVAAFAGGGGTWSMDVALPSGAAERWAGNWKVGNRDAPDRRIWTVEYCGNTTRRSGTSHSRDLSLVARELEVSLREVLLFSMNQSLSGFSESFQSALDTIKSQGEHGHGYHQDLAPPGVLSTTATALLDACQKAWVFGGMGSWNDLMFEGNYQQTYETLSERLFNAVNAAIASSASSSFAAHSSEDR